MAGHTWQPFGGAGYFVLLALIGLALLAAGLLILLPLAIGWRAGRRSERRARGMFARTVVYFSCLGLGYLCIEIPLMQQFTLFLGYPAWSLSAVLFALLLFSGIGSRFSHRVPLWAALLSIPALAGAYAAGLSSIFDLALAAPIWTKVALTGAILAPLGLLMGVPFPKGIALLSRYGLDRLKPQLQGKAGSGELVAWAWASNGAVSVVASVLAALLSLSWGFSAVLACGAISYLGAFWSSRSLGRG
jgi:hypothetical protein